MHYDVTYQLDGETYTDHIVAIDAAAAAAQAGQPHAQDPQRFELLLVQLIGRDDVVSLASA